MAYYEDLVVGRRVALGAFAFTQDNIIAFARQFDPQPFHVDVEAGRRSHFGGLCASGWHTASVCMRLIVDWHEREAAALLARGEKPPIMGPSPGFKDMRWPRPVFGGDTIAYHTEIVSKRLSKNRPEWGIGVHRQTGINQGGEMVIQFDSTGFSPRRSA